MKKLLLILLMIPSFAYAQLEVLEHFKDYNFPFEFSSITGITQNAEVGNEFTNNYYPTFSNSVYLDGKFIFIGGIFKRKDFYNTEKIYYKACYHGRQFYINANDVELLSWDKSSLDTLSVMPDSIQQKFWEWTKLLAKKYDLKMIGDINNIGKKHAPYGLSLIDWGIYDESEYTDGTSIYFKFLNPTKKRIKYIYVNLYGKNRVGDRIYEGGKYVKTLKFIGPIESGAIGDVSQEYVWFTDLVDSAKIMSIKVQYMDGTTRTITDIKKITWPEHEYSYWNEINNDFDKLEPIE